MPNTQWRIAYGDYDFAIDRQTLAYSLTETKTGTVWADGLSTGWIELEERESGERTRYNFSDAKLISVAEKSSHQGKRILFGLDLLGIPIDLYFICSEKEIQLTVEANRDTRTHKVQDVGLLPGLVSVPDDGASYLVLPRGEGALIRGTNVPTAPQEFGIWAEQNGLTMPFSGAVRCEYGDIRDAFAALALITDSAYGQFIVSHIDPNNATADVVFSRDPERRRLDIRIVLIPKSNHIAIAHAYREKLIVDRNHMTLRKKIRERPELDNYIGSAFIYSRRETDDVDQILHNELGIDRVARVRSESVDDAVNKRLDWYPLADADNRWTAIDDRMAEIGRIHADRGIGIASFSGDWAAIALDLVIEAGDIRNKWIWAPLQSAVYHDSIISPHKLPSSESNMLEGLLRLAPPYYFESSRSLGPGWVHRRKLIQRTNAVLAPLHRLTFTAFLTAHRLLAECRHAQEAVYSDKTYILVNINGMEDFEREDVALPPNGFYARHAQMEAHFALRVGDVTFATPAWRIRRSNDGKPLETSEDIITQEFPV